MASAGHRFLFRGHFFPALLLSAVLLAVGTAPAHGEVPDFGHPLDSGVSDGPSSFCAGQEHTLSTWPEPRVVEEGGLPLKAGDGKFLGKHWVDRINGWYAEGTAAGLSQDTFRSFDGGHSSLPHYLFPQINVLDPLRNYLSPCATIFRPRVTVGVQSYGAQPKGVVRIQGRSVIEYITQQVMRGTYTGAKQTPLGGLVFFRAFYENNFLFAAPAVNTFTAEKDGFSLLSPYYLHSIGASHSDARLLAPLVCASAALPPRLKTRILRGGLYVPTMMYLFKSSIGGDMKAPETHVPAYLPLTPKEDSARYDAYMDRLVHAAHTLDHIPPVARMKYVNMDVKDEYGYATPAYYQADAYLFAGALRKGETFSLTIDLRDSWVDGVRTLTGFHVAVLRGHAEITPLNQEGSLLRVVIPWSLTPVTHDFRTDILVLVNDGAYDSAPAYLSVRHIHPFSTLTKAIRVK